MSNKPQSKKPYSRKSKPRRSVLSPARRAALHCIREVRERDAFAQEVLAASVDTSHMSYDDRSFATLLVLGVVSTRGTLDDALNRCVKNPSDIQDDVRDALCMSAYELLFLKKSPYAAVDQGVELVRSFAPRAAGLANFVLRRLVVLAQSFPWGNPRSDKEAWARSFAFPLWLSEKLLDEQGPESATLFMKASNEQAPLFVAENALKINDNKLASTFAGAKESFEPAVCGGSLVLGGYRLHDSRALLVPEIKQLIDSGKMLVADASSQLVALSILEGEKPASFLEIGAGRATKTILLQSGAFRRWGSQIARYVTLDNHRFKTSLLKKRAAAYGVLVSEALTGDATNLSSCTKRETFDTVFIDAPCSGLGTLRRHPEIRWRVTSSDIEAFAETQLALLKAAAHSVNPGGLLAYATCTITSEENSSTIKQFLASEEGSAFQLEPIAQASCIAPRLTPGSADAHFAVRLRKHA